MDEYNQPVGLVSEINTSKLVAGRKVSKLHEKVANQRKDFLHKISRQIANANTAIVIEDLNMHCMSRNSYL